MQSVHRPVMSVCLVQDILYKTPSAPERSHFSTLPVWREDTGPARFPREPGAYDRKHACRAPTSPDSSKQPHREAPAAPSPQRLRGEIFHVKHSCAPRTQKKRPDGSMLHLTDAAPNVRGSFQSGSQFPDNRRGTRAPAHSASPLQDCRCDPANPEHVPH